MAEVYELWQGIKQLKAKGVEEATVYGDSRVIIQAMNCVSQCHSLKLERMINKIKSVSKTFHRIEYFHIL